MGLSIRQFVPSKVCLTCDGCCRFKTEDSPWRPKLGEGERLSLGLTLTGPAWLDAGHHIKTLNKAGACACTFFNTTDNTCRIYEQRPFECELYPFVLSKKDNGPIGVYMHLSCPYIQDHLNTQDLEAHAAYLKEFFDTAGGRQWIKDNGDAVHDYSAFALELQHLFDVRPAGQDGLLDVQDQFNRYCRQTPRLLSSHHFTSIYLWADFFTFEFEKINEALAVFARQGKDRFLYMPPLGKAVDAGIARACFERMGESSIARIENIAAPDIGLYEALGARLYVKAQEYIYRREDIAELKGNAYKSQRHDVNGCERAHQVALRPYVDGDKAACIALFAKWAAARKATHEDEVYHYMIEDNAAVHARLLEYGAHLGMAVYVAIIEEQIVGYTAGFAQNDDTWCVYAEITDPDIRGLNAWIFHAFSRTSAVQPFDLINAMDDFGMPQLGWSKELWHPVEKRLIYNATLK